MVKVLLLIMSGDEKADLGVRFAYRSIENQRFEDLKVIFFGPSQKRILEYSGEMKKMLDELKKRGAVDAACIGVAKDLGIEKPLEDLGLTLVPVGNRIKYFLEKGYQVISF
ncbi:MAG: hypothetical protein DJ555_03145 [Desulfurococcaceae archaeon]|nr:MAG: hypothetical protein DJ555_03145 [Desulfurococcaceae archaeon]